jgi:hypothetical protein
MGKDAKFKEERRDKKKERTQDEENLTTQIAELALGKEQEAAASSKPVHFKHHQTDAQPTIPKEFVLKLEYPPWAIKLHEKFQECSMTLDPSLFVEAKNLAFSCSGLSVAIKPPKFVSMMMGSSPIKWMSSRGAVTLCKAGIRICSASPDVPRDVIDRITSAIIIEQEKLEAERLIIAKVIMAKAEQERGKWTPAILDYAMQANERQEVELVDINVGALATALAALSPIPDEEVKNWCLVDAATNSIATVLEHEATDGKKRAISKINIQAIQSVVQSHMTEIVCGLALLHPKFVSVKDVLKEANIFIPDPKTAHGSDIPLPEEVVAYNYLLIKESEAIPRDPSEPGPTIRGLPEDAKNVEKAPPVAPLDDKQPYDVNYATRIHALAKWEKARKVAAVPETIIQPPTST